MKVTTLKEGYAETLGEKKNRITRKAELEERLNTLGWPWSLELSLKLDQLILEMETARERE